jgi:endonuclease YncB( thermonuclease family)
MGGAPFPIPSAHAARLAAAILAWLLLGQAGPALAADGPPACTGLEDGPLRTVTRVIDGETLALDDGTELRLIGALAPRAIDAGAQPGTWPMERAAADALRNLVLGTSIEIRFGGERGDRYGRLQGHAFLRTPDGVRWVQGHLLEQGLARAYTLSASRACAPELLAAESAARRGGQGIWAEAAYQVRSADQPAALLRHLATFQLVEGRVVHVAETRGSIYLNFAADRRRGFSVSLKAADRDRLGAYAAAPWGLERRQVRVRGWIERRRGPVIDLSAAGELEVMTEIERLPARKPYPK